MIPDFTHLKNFFFNSTMSLVLAPGVVNNPAIDSLLQSLSERIKLEWIARADITDIEPAQIDNTYYAIYKYTSYGRIDEMAIMLSLLGSSAECTLTLVSEFARIYSLATHKHKNDVNQFRRYPRWLYRRNDFINGFTEYDNNYYMVADRKFYHCYSLYGFCTACGILRCSPVWCICGHKQLSDGWTSNDKQLDEFIKKSQLQTISPNDAYLEWIQFDCIEDWGYDVCLYGLPTHSEVALTPLEITNETHYLYYVEVNYLLMRHIY